MSPPIESRVRARAKVPAFIFFACRIVDMDNALLDITVNLDSGIIFVNDVPDCFLTPEHALEHFYADANDGSDDAAINYDCVAWQ